MVIRCRPFHGLVMAGAAFSWGLRPRHYADACFAGLTCRPLARSTLVNNHPNRSLTNTRSEKELGALVAEVLRGAWRESAGAANLSADKIAAVTPLLYSTGSAALAWWRVRRRVSSPTVREGNLREKPLLTRGLLTPSAAIELLRDAYRQLRLQARIHEQEIKHVLSLLRAVDIEPVLVKGWAIARRYPDRALRPYGDIDLCVRPDQFAKAAAALKCLEDIEGHYVDLHSGFADIGVNERLRMRPAFRVPTSVGLFRATENPTKVGTLNQSEWDDLFSRSQLVSLGDEPGLPSPLRGEGLAERSARATPPLIPPHKWGGKPETTLQVRVLSDDSRSGHGGESNRRRRSLRRVQLRPTHAAGDPRLSPDHGQYLDAPAALCVVGGRCQLRSKELSGSGQR
jgi:hypothetical protein